MTRPFGAASVRLRVSPDLFGLIEATSKVSLSVGPGADGACAATEPVNRTMAMPRCSIRMLQEPGRAGFVSVPGWTVRAVDDQHIDRTALCLELETKLFLQGRAERGEIARRSSGPRVLGKRGIDVVSALQSLSDPPHAVGRTWLPSPQTPAS